MTKPKMLPMGTVRSKLVAFWLVGSGVLVLLLFSFSVIGDVFQGHVQELWNWALPNFLPTLSLMLAVLASEALRPEFSKIQVRRFFSRIAFGLSVFYILLILITLLVHPFSPLQALELLAISNFWLGPVQGLVDASLAVVFISGSLPDPAKN